MSETFYICTHGSKNRLVLFDRVYYNIASFHNYFMKNKIFFLLIGSVLFVGAGCSKAPASNTAQVPSQSSQSATQAPAGSDAYLAFVHGSLAAASIEKYDEEPEKDAEKMKTAAKISAATKFRFTEGNGSVRLLVVAVKSPSDLAAVVAEIKEQYETLQKLSSSARIAWLPGDATHAVVSNWKAGDEAFADKVVAAFGGAVATSVDSDESLPADTEKDSAATAIFKVGENIMGRWKGGSRWYPGKITKVSGDEVYVHYDDGSDEVLPPMNVAHLNQPNSSVSVGQSVLAKWNNGSYYSGKVAALDDSTVTVKWDDGSSPSKLPYSSVELPGR